MILKLDKPYTTSSKAIRDTRSESIDSIGSTITADVSSKIDDTNSDFHGEALFNLDNDLPRNESFSHSNLIRQSLASIVVLNSSSNPKVQSLLNTYNGHLINVGTHLLKSLHDVAPAQLAARVGDFNENLFYEMQGHKKDVGTIIAHENQCSFSKELQHDVQRFEIDLRQSLRHQSLTYRGSFMRTEQTMYQPAHVDYDYPVLQEYGHRLFIAFFPLTEEGTFLQLWEKSAENHTCESIEGTVVFIPYGKMLVVPADTIHGGGFKRGQSGNLRFHLYIELQSIVSVDGNDQDDMLMHPMNKYTEEHDRRRELCETYVDANGLEHLLGVFFDR